jgi:hypothetical protein
MKSEEKRTSADKNDKSFDLVAMRECGPSTEKSSHLPIKDDESFHRIVQNILPTASLSPKKWKWRVQL